MRNQWKCLVLGLGALLVFGTARMASAATCGDLNNDGQVRISDALLLLQVVSGANDGSTLCGGAGVTQCGDMNQDGGITIADVVIMLNYLAGNQTLFPICTGAGLTVACTGPLPAGAPAGATGSFTVSGNLTTSQVWPPFPCVIYVDGTTFIQPGVVITVKPGGVVLGKKATSTPSALVFLRGSKINAAGTPDKPIYMGSDQPVGQRGISDWGGLSINGKAPVNCPGGECLAEGLTGVPFGGTDPNDNSGVIRYLRLEYSGRELTVDNELDMTDLNGVGKATVYEHIDDNIGFDDQRIRLAWQRPALRIVNRRNAASIVRDPECARGCDY